ncbi:hypothetical protein FSB84_00025 [Pseudobacter ginsenosidimutans]|uniref:hypothetical protein n=1 Tax=Pseudobacter ginsenosidimutans TaxID=661488 RepID=UPI0011BBE758|nr:hypothetical protein [Pseudobacter ginsenosidimutans]QEC40164.1 hypothetical protein FSB84_00025 [Pseudobacter ginsenosidimutans]
MYYGLANATEGISIRSSYSKENLVSFAGRLNYSFAGKYLASFSIRTDGSSKLGEEINGAFSLLLPWPGASAMKIFSRPPIRSATSNCE